jgi:hypothetical protein
MRLRWVVGVAFAVAVVGAGTGGLVTAASEDADEITAEHLGDPSEGESMWEMLSPEEQAAVQRSGVDWVEARRSAGDGDAKAESKVDKAGKIGFSILAVGMTLAAAAAPFLLF